MCEGPDLNRGTPARTDLESVAFDRAWLPSRERKIRLEAIINIRRLFQALSNSSDFRQMDPHRVPKQAWTTDTSHAKLPDVIGKQ